jgi:hypothetical protein
MSHLQLSKKIGDFIRVVSGAMHNEFLADIEGQLMQIRRQNRETCDTGRMIDLASAQQQALADIRRSGRSLAESLVQGGYPAKSTLGIVFFADGGGGVQLIRQNWLPARIELQELQIKLEAEARATARVKSLTTSGAKRKSNCRRGRTPIDATADHCRWHKAYCDARKAGGRVDQKELARGQGATYPEFRRVIKRMESRRKTQQ